MKIALHYYTVKVFLAIFFFLILMPLSVYSVSHFHTYEIQVDDETLRGTVTDDAGEPLIGVNIILASSPGVGTVSDFDGSFELTVQDQNDTLVFSYIGFQPQRIYIGERRNFDVVLLSNAEQLEEIVVVGYGSQKKSTMVGAVSNVSTKELKQSPVANLGNALGGRLPGLLVQQRGGSPGGDAPTIRIRGFGTFNNSSPLVLVDGVERGFDQIDPNEVESISILKDASATAVFGVRGANGVIMVTTKRGEVGKPSISVSFNQAYQTPTQLPEYLGSYETAILKNEGLRNDGLEPQFTDQELEYFKNGTKPYLYPNTDWFDQVLSDFAPQTKVNMNVSGGTALAKYFISGSFLAQNGLYKYGQYNDNYRTDDRFVRYNFRSNLDLDVTDDFTASINLAGRNEQRFQPGTGLSTVISNVLRILPYDMPAFNPDGSLAPYQGAGNPIGMIRGTGYRQDVKNIIELSLRLNHDLDFITEGLSARVMGSYDNDYAYFQGFSKNYQTVNYTEDENGTPVYTPTSLRETPLNYFYGYGGTHKRFYSEYAVSYARDVGEHSLTGLALFNLDRYWNNQNWAQSKMGLVGRVTYNYGGRYLAEFNVGYNGTDNFAPGQRFGLFPAVSAGWLISEESYVRESLGWISFLKLRGSYGLVGNSNIGGRRWLYFPDKYGGQGSYVFGDNPQGAPGLGETELGNPLVTWEKARKTDIGIEGRLFQEKIGFEFDVFYEYRNDILTTRGDVSSIVGQSNLPPVNAGIMENKGFESELSYNDVLGGAFNYFLKGNFTFARNTRLDLTQPDPRYPWLSQENTPLGQVFGYTTEGFFNSQEEIENWADQTSFGAIQPGDLKYKDLNGDGVINSDDQGPIGYPLFPEIIYGFSGGFDYKGFDFSALFQGVSNGSSYFELEAGWEFFNGAKVLEHHLGRWTPETKETATYPRISSASSDAANNFQTSDFWLRDAAYLRLKNVEIGYTLPENLLERIKIDNIRVYANGTNLLTWDDVDWVDPEMRNDNGSRSFRGWQYPLMKVFNFGLSVSL